MIIHSITEGTKNLFRSFWLSVTAIFIIVVSICSVVLVASTWVTTGYVLRQLDKQAVLYVNLKSGTTEQARNIMQNEIKALKEVREITFVDKETAKSDLKKNEFAGKGIEQLELISQTTKNSLDVVLESFKIYPKSAEQYSTILNFVKQDKYELVIDSIQDVSSFIEKLKNIHNLTSLIGGVMVLVFASISILVMANILRIAIYSRREEIEIMRLVGATNNYIRGPFIAEGMLYNLIASFFAMCFFIPLYIYLAPKIKDTLGIEFNSDSTNLINNLYISLFLTNVGGLLIGGLSAYLTTRKYLKL